MGNKFDNFLEELIQEILDKYQEKILTVVLYGSFARKEVKDGSDIDLIIHLRRGFPGELLTKDVWRMVSELSRKYNIDADWTLHVPFLPHIHPPVIVMEYEDMDWEKGIVRNSALRWTIWLSSVTKSVFLANLKKDGRILYGENVLAKLNIRVSVLDRIVSFFMYPVFMLNKSIARLYYQLWKKKYKRCHMG